MHILSIIRIIGILIMCFSGTMLIPAFVALIYGDGGGKAFMQAFALSLTVGMLLWWPCHHHKQELRSRDDLNVKLVRPAGDMMGLHGEFLPASKRYINDYIQYVKSDFLAGLGFGATQMLGENTGIYIGYSVDTGRNVYLQPSLASQGVKGTVTNALASAFVGSLGGGKSFCNNLLVYYSVLFGGQAVILDPKSGAKRSYLKRVGTALH